MRLLEKGSLRPESRDETEFLDDSHPILELK